MVRLFHFGSFSNICVIWFKIYLFIIKKIIVYIIFFHILISFINYIFILSCIYLFKTKLHKCLTKNISNSIIWEFLWWRGNMKNINHIFLWQFKYIVKINTFMFIFCLQCMWCLAYLIFFRILNHEY